MAIAEMRLPFFVADPTMLSITRVFFNSKDCGLGRSGSRQNIRFFESDLPQPKALAMFATNH
jgi:hypothetical protein